MTQKNNQNDAATTASNASTEDKSNNLSLEEKASQVVEIIHSDKPEQQKEDEVWEILKNV